LKSPAGTQRLAVASQRRRLPVRGGLPCEADVEVVVMAVVMVVMVFSLMSLPALRRRHDGSQGVATELVGGVAVDVSFGFENGLGYFGPQFGEALF
jgi:hypothetical protein